MMGRQTGDQSQLFYLFNLEKRIPARHLLRLINPTVTRVLAGMREKPQPFDSAIRRPSIDPELTIRMLIVAYSYGIRSERHVQKAAAVKEGWESAKGPVAKFITYFFNDIDPKRAWP
jgi:transposase